MSILERGGNAFDAAVATGITLQIVEPHLSGPAGDMPAILYSARNSAGMRILCTQGTAAAAATVPQVPRTRPHPDSGNRLSRGGNSGAFDGWMLLLRDYGTMTVEQVLEPAIGYAKNGFPVLPRVTMSLLPLVEFFKAEWPSSTTVLRLPQRAPLVCLAWAWIGGESPSWGELVATASRRQLHAVCRRETPPGAARPCGEEARGVPQHRTKVNP